MNTQAIKFTSLASVSVVKGSELSFKSLAQVKANDKVELLAAIVFTSIAK